MNSQQKSVNQTHADIVAWVENLKFKRKLVGGVDEADVLQKMQQLNTLYETALIEQRARYEALLSAKAGDADG